MNAIKIRAPIHFEPKKWGEEIWIVNQDEYCGKILKFKAGAQFSNHFHVLKKESFYVLEGEIEFKITDTTDASQKTYKIKTGQVIDIPPYCPHQVKAITDAKLIEFSTHHFESDSYRIEKGDNQK